MESSSISNLKFDNDLLLIKNRPFINKKLNIYGLLIEKEDMIINKKGEIFKKCPYICEEKEEIKKLIYQLKDKNFIKLRQLLSDYLNIKRIRKITFCNWLKQKRYPLPLIRVICNLLNEDITKILEDKKISDFCNKSKIMLPSSYDEIKSDFMTYFIGIHLGDGTLNKERWKVVDGDKEFKNLRYSYEFLKKIKNRLSKSFSINPKIYKIKGKKAYELIISNKWFCKYLKWVYDLEFNEKIDPNIPNISKDKRNLIFRGLMDTDGSIKNYRVAIGTKYPKLYENLRNILNNHKIGYREKINNIQRKNVVYILEIKKEYIKKFIETIGFSHPRKLNEMVKYLKTTSASSIFSGYINYKPKISEKEFIKICYFLRPIKNAGKVRFISEFNKLNKNKKKKIINNLKLNFGVNKEPDEKGYINSYKIERILTNSCIYKKIRNPSKIKEINNLVIKFNNIWE